jgi:hypothetical protein
MGVGPLGSSAVTRKVVVVLAAPDRGVLRLTVEVVRAVAILGAVMTLAGCPANWADDIGADNANGDNGSDGGNGGTGGDGGTGTGGNGGKGIGGDGGDANGGTGANGGNGGNGSPNADGTDGASGGGNSDSDSVAGSGHLVSGRITLPGVTSVVVRASFVVRLTAGEPEQATIRIDDNIIDLIDVTVTGGQLRLGLKQGSKVRNATLSAEITVRHLNRLTTSGASRVTLVSLPTDPALQLDASGASQITGSVRVDHLEASISGAAMLALSGKVGSLQLNAAGTSQLLGPDLAVADLDAELSDREQATPPSRSVTLSPRRQVARRCCATVARRASPASRVPGPH